MVRHLEYFLGLDPFNSIFQSQTNDVIIHCKNGEKLRTNKLPMVIGSKFIRSMFAGNESCCCCATSDLVSSPESRQSCFIMKVTFDDQGIAPRLFTDVTFLCAAKKFR